MTIPWSSTALDADTPTWSFGEKQHRTRSLWPIAQNELLLQFLRSAQSATIGPYLVLLSRTPFLPWKLQPSPLAGEGARGTRAGEGARRQRRKRSHTSAVGYITGLGPGMAEWTAWRTSWSTAVGLRRKTKMIAELVLPLESWAGWPRVGGFGVCERRSECSSNNCGERMKR